jgi:hypothetical protein
VPDSLKLYLNPNFRAKSDFNRLTSSKMRVNLVLLIDEHYKFYTITEKNNISETLGHSPCQRVEP